MKNANDTRNWRDEKGFHPMAERAENSIAGRMAGEVLRVIRKALAHDNIVYLNADCHEEEDTKVEYLGFLSRYEESGDEKKIAETYRLVATTEDAFLEFVKAWAMWISKFDRNFNLVEAA